jgi:ppGpp synthetase/RelA/SpoT-type nucleotidyltranferase
MHRDLLERYDLVLPELRACGEAKRAELAALLAAEAGLKTHSVTMRLKSRASLAMKLARPDRRYDSLWAVTDLVGLRVIVYFEHDVECVAGIIESKFDVDFARSIDKRRRDATTFGYRSLHYVCAMQLPGGIFSREARCEVQVRTVLEHAWAEIEHDLGYKATTRLPEPVKRRLHRVAGLLELADQEFESIRDDLHEYSRGLPERIASASEVDSVPLDRVSLDALLDCAEVEELDRAIASTLGRELGAVPFFPDYLLAMLGSSGIRSVGAARAGVAKNAPTILAMVKPYFAFAWETWQLSPSQMDRIFRGYSLFFLAHAEVLGARALGIDKVERLTRLYRELDYPDDERAAQIVASKIVEAFRDLGTRRG